MTYYDQSGLFLPSTSQVAQPVAQPVTYMTYGGFPGWMAPASPVSYHVHHFSSYPGPVPDMYAPPIDHPDIHLPLAEGPWSQQQVPLVSPGPSRGETGQGFSGPAPTMPPNNRAPKRRRIRSAHVDSTASSSTRKLTRSQHPRIQAPREVQRRLTWVSQSKKPHLYQLIVDRQKRLKERGSRAAKEDFYCPVIECTWNVGRNEKTTKASNVRDHLEKHIQEKPAMCSGCGARFSSIGNCTRHIECHRFKNDPICGTAEVIEPAET